MASRPGESPKPGEARCDGESYTQLLNRDSKSVPDFLHEESYRYLGSDDIPTAHYVSREFFDLEIERMWPKVWQMACREEDIPKVGDHVVYEIAHWSFIIARSAPGKIRAYYNSCLHRGRKLRTHGGSVKHFRCPFHGFTWNLDGTLKHIPCRWDFPHIKDEETKLPEARVATWGGFVFINMDDEAPSLEEYLGEDMLAHFERWRLEDCYKVVHVAKIVPANWKATAEAFMEAMHAEVTHPQILPYSGDINGRYDVYGDNVNRNITPMAVPSPLVADNPPTEQQILDDLVNTSGRINDEGADDRLLVPEGMTARQFMAQMSRDAFSAEDGYDYSDTSDAELLDAMVYNVFPNLSPWGGFVPNIIYRWRPDGANVHSCLMEVMFLKRVPKKGPRPEPCKMRMLSANEAWSTAAELGALGPIFDQDMGNLPYVQEGMRTSKKQAISLANYQEIRIRHFHQTLEKYVYGNGQ